MRLVAPGHTFLEFPGEPAMPTSAAIEGLRARIGNESGAVEDFLAAHAFPIAEPPLYTFVYVGSARAVRLRHWIHGLPTSQPFARIDGTDVWYRTIELPDDSRVEYKIEVIGDGASRWIEDPLNPNRARDPFGANSVVAARGYEVPEWTRGSEDLRRGVTEEIAIESSALGSERRVTVYRPYGYRETRHYPLLVVHDGPDYVEYANLLTVLDHLTARFEIPAMVVALLHPGHRMEEYSADPAHAAFVVDELLPRLDSECSLMPGRDSRGIMGASLGAVAAFHTALSRPGHFGRLLLQSGTFAFTDIGENTRGPMLDRIVEMMNAYRADPVPVADRAFVSVGVYESLAWENRALVPVLRRAGMEVCFVEARDGHNWENWRDRLRDALAWLYPGPLWMIYE